MRTRGSTNDRLSHGLTSRKTRKLLNIPTSSNEKSTIGCSHWCCDVARTTEPCALTAGVQHNARPCHRLPLGPPRSNSRATSRPRPSSHASSSAGYMFALTRSVSPAIPSCTAAASARARLDSFGWMKMLSGLDLDRGRDGPSDGREGGYTGLGSGPKASSCEERRRGSLSTEWFSELNGHALKNCADIIEKRTYSWCRAGTYSTYSMMNCPTVRVVIAIIISLNVLVYQNQHTRGPYGLLTRS